MLAANKATKIQRTMRSFAREPIFFSSEINVIFFAHFAHFSLLSIFFFLHSKDFKLLSVLFNHQVRLGGSSGTGAGSQIFSPSCDKGKICPAKQERTSTRLKA